MPELPDIEVYLRCLAPRVLGEKLESIRLRSPFLVRSFDPPLTAAHGQTVTGLRRLGKRVVFELTDDLYLILHLMIAGRLRWRDREAKLPLRALAAFDFPAGFLLLTEAGTKKRASLYLVRGEEGLAAHDPGGLEIAEATPEEFAAALTVVNRTLKRALTDPRVLSGIGNAYSDEILHRARLSPFKRTGQLDAEELERLWQATREVLDEWTARLVAEVGDGFPDKVTAFRPEMAVHGRHRQPCPVCGDPVQRIIYAQNEANYCATCQTGGKVLADRVLSQLLKGDWPRTLEELEQLRRR